MMDNLCVLSNAKCHENMVLIAVTLSCLRNACHFTWIFQPIFAWICNWYQLIWRADCCIVIKQSREAWHEGCVQMKSLINTGKLKWSLGNKKICNVKICLVPWPLYDENAVTFKSIPRVIHEGKGLLRMSTHLSLRLEGAPWLARPPVTSLFSQQHNLEHKEPIRCWRQKKTLATGNYSFDGSKEPREDRE